MGFIKKLIGWGILLAILIFGATVFINWLGIQIRKSELLKKIEGLNQFYASGTYTREKVWREITGYIEKKGLDAPEDEIIVQKTPQYTIIQVTLYDSLVIPKKTFYFEFELADTEDVK